MEGWNVDAVLQSREQPDTEGKEKACLTPESRYLSYRTSSLGTSAATKSIALIGGKAHESECTPGGDATGHMHRCSSEEQDLTLTEHEW